MSNIAFFSFNEKDRNAVLLIKGRALNSTYSGINFRSKDLLRRWNTNDPAKIKQAIDIKMQVTSRTIVFVGSDTHKSYWVKYEVEKTIERGKKLYAIYLKNKESSTIPKFLRDHNVRVYNWSESKLQELVQR